MSNNISGGNGSNGSEVDNGSTPGSIRKFNGAKGKNQGQTTLAAKVARWEILINNLTKEPDQLAKVKDLLDPFTPVVQEARDLRDELKVLEAQNSVRIVRRDDILNRGGELYNLLRLRLKSHLGPQNTQLKAYGFKAQKKTGPKKKLSPDPVPGSTTTAPNPAPAASAVQPQHEG